ncbi:MAG: SHOCT domain-containing protein [Lachnospiraceae bacterium]|nr:SHOCT domain-containing protein [Lachnospiraceae bacterium]
MYPMAHRLQKSLEDASFDYTDEELAADIEVIENIETEGSAAASEETPQKSQLFDRVKETTWSIAKRGVSAAKGAFNTMGQSISSVFNKKKDSPSEENTQDENRPMMTFDERIEMIRKLKDLLDDGIITQEEFDQKKAQLLEL